jgi:hypothetical protein
MAWLDSPYTPITVWIYVRFLGRTPLKMATYNGSFRGDPPFTYHGFKMLFACFGHQAEDRLRTDADPVRPTLGNRGWY